MSDQLQKHERFNGTIKRLLITVGMWPIADASVRYRLLALVHGLPLVVASCAMLNFCYHNLTNLSLLVKGLSASCSYLTTVTKIICLTTYRKRLIELHETLDATFNRDLKNPDLRPILLSPLDKFCNPAFAVSSLTYAVLMIYWIIPLITMAVRFSNGADDIPYLLPFPARYPWNTNTSIWLYLIHYTFEVYAGVCLGIFSTAIDSLFGYYAFQIAGQLRTLSSRMCSVRSTENYEEVIRDCITRHQILIRCQRNLECIFGPLILWMIVTSAVAICALIYQGAYQGGQVSAGKTILAVVYVVMKSLQIFLYGAFGTFLMNENDNFRDAIYSTDWPGSGEKRFMTNVLIIITFEPDVLKACSLSIISVDMFIAVMNTALSYFFMLRALEEGNAS